MKTVALCFVLCIISTLLRAQITEVDVGVNGLTCSLCSRSVEMHIKKLDFVKEVKMNLEHTEGQIFFKENKRIDINKIAQAVVDAGFTVRILKATIQMNNVVVSNNTCWGFNGDNYQFVHVSNTTLKGATTIQFLGEKYQQKKDLKKWQPLLKSACSVTDGKIYFVSI